MKIPHFQVGNPKMYYARRRVVEWGQGREIGILGHDGEFPLLGVKPDLTIRQASIKSNTWM